MKPKPAPSISTRRWRVLREHGITLGRLQGGGGKGTRARPEIADYVLVYRNTKLAVIEAKAWDKPHTEGVGQAKSYAAKLAVRFTYATNGQAIYGIDMATGAEGDLATFPSPDELWELTFAEVNAWRDRFAAVPFEDKGGTWQGRYYQDIAITRVLEAIEAGRDRILLTLATGAGHWYGQDLHRVPTRLEAVPEPLEPGGLEEPRRAHPPPAHSVSGRSQHSGQSGLQRVLGVCRRCAGAD